MRQIRRFILAAFLAATMVPAARAADLTFYVGGLNPGDINVGALRRPLDGGVTFGVRFNTNFVPMVGLEHTLGYSPNFLVPPNQPAFEDAKGILYNANLILNIPLGKFTPYATAGVGFIWQYGGEDLPVGAEFSFNYGGGLKWKLFGPAGLRFDARGYTTTKIFNSSVNMFELSAGLFVGF